MTTREAIRRIKEHNERHSKEEIFAVHITEALNMAIEALEKQIPKKPVRIHEEVEAWNRRTDQEWISVKDRLPNEYEYVLIWCKGAFGTFHMEIAEKITYSRKKIRFVRSDTNYELEKVTHWRPLPEPPKGE